MPTPRNDVPVQHVVLYPSPDRLWGPGLTVRHYVGVGIALLAIATTVAAAVLIVIAFVHTSPATTNISPTAPAFPSSDWKQLVQHAPQLAGGQS